MLYPVVLAACITYKRTKHCPMRQWVWLSECVSGTVFPAVQVEFNCVIRASGMGLGFQSLMSDLGIQIPLRVWTDSSAAIGICNR